MKLVLCEGETAFWPERLFVVRHSCGFATFVAGLSLQGSAAAKQPARQRRRCVHPFHAPQAARTGLDP